MKRILYGALVGILVMLLQGCAGAAANEVTIEVSDLGYSPSEVTVVVGKEARLTLHNVGTKEHELGIVEIPLVTSGGGDSMAGHNMENMSGMATPLQLHVVADVGGITSLDFTPTKVGEYMFHCQIPGHSETGILTVAKNSD